MGAQLVFFALLLALVGGFLGEASIAFVKLETKITGEHAIKASFQTALVNLKTSVISQVSSSNPDGPFTAPADLGKQSQCASGASTCNVYTTAHYVLQTGQAGGVASTINNEQRAVVSGSGAAVEGRVSYAVTVNAVDANGAVWASQTYHITYRTYKSVSGASGADVVGLTDDAGQSIAGAEGDAGGLCDGGTATTSCDSSLSTSLSNGDDTRIHAVSVCVPGGTGSCAGATPRPLDTYSSPSYTNGNGSSAWSH